MGVTFIGRNEIIVELPKLAQVGEKFNLVGSRFTPHAQGQVVQILAQNAGHTTVRMSLTNGKTLSQRQVDRNIKKPTPDIERFSEPLEEDEEDFESQLQRRRSSVTEESGGTPWLMYDAQPNAVVKEDFIVEDQITNEETTLSGIKILIKGSTNMTHKQGRTTIAPISSVVESLVLGTNATIQQSSFLSQQEHIKIAGRKLDTQVGGVGCIRKSQKINYGVK